MRTTISHVEPLAEHGEPSLTVFTSSGDQSHPWKLMSKDGKSEDFLRHYRGLRYRRARLCILL
jgi:hypothetical protein